MKNSAAQSYIRQLCCLGLGGQIIMPELLRALHSFIPSLSNMFHWADENYQMSNVYSENSALYPLQALYFQEYYNSKEVNEIKTTFSQAMRIGRGWENWERLGPEFLSSELFNTVLRPSGARYAIETTICENGRGLGSLLLMRSPNDKAFGKQDEANLHNLGPYVAHGLRGTRNLRGELAPSGESGTLVIDGQDKLVHFCPAGQRLLLLATHAKVVKQGLPSSDSPALKRLGTNLRGILKGQAHPVPVLRQQNAWGEFVFRAYPLSTQGEPDGSIAVVVERHEPLPITLMRNMRISSMTTRQREVCLLLSFGHSHSEIAQRMHISKHTVTDYVRKIYEKLEVRSSGELMKKLRNASFSID